METEEGRPLVPQHETGKSLDLEKKVVAGSVTEAMNIFKAAYKRLLNPHLWQKMTGIPATAFKLETSDGVDPRRYAQEQDYIRIDIPGPGSATGEGYDWVRIEKISHTPDASADESFGITLRSAPNPAKPDEGVAHFFKEEATSTFIIKRTGKTVSAHYHGRNEIPNVEYNNLADKIRNSIVANAAQAGLSELQWKAFLDGLLSV